MAIVLPRLQPQTNIRQNNIRLDSQPVQYYRILSNIFDAYLLCISIYIDIKCSNYLNMYRLFVAIYKHNFLLAHKDDASDDGTDDGTDGRTDGTDDGTDHGATFPDAHRTTSRWIDKIRGRWLSFYPGFSRKRIFVKTTYALFRNLCNIIEYTRILLVHIYYV